MVAISPLVERGEGPEDGEEQGAEAGEEEVEDTGSIAQESGGQQAGQDEAEANLGEIYNIEQFELLTTH